MSQKRIFAQIGNRPPEIWVQWLYQAKNRYGLVIDVQGFLEEMYGNDSFHKATLARTLNRWGFEFGKGTRSQHLKEV